MPETVGEIVEQHGPCSLMIRILELAELLGRRPCGEWDYRFTSDPRWRFCVNGGVHDSWSPIAGLIVPRFHAYIEADGLPLAMFDAAGGITLGLEIEDAILAALAREIEACRGQGGATR